MDLINLLLTSLILTNLLKILSFLISFIGQKWVIFHKFDSISDSVNTKELQKSIKNSNSFIEIKTLIDGDKLPEGIFLNYKERYFGYVHNYNVSNNYSSKNHTTICIFGKVPIQIKNINIYENSTDLEKESCFIKILLSNNFYNGNFKEILLPFKNFPPKENQQIVIDKIKKKYNEHPFKICRSLIWGSPGMGKSFIGKLLAKDFKSSCCFDIKITEPGTQILTLWETVKPTLETPLIIQIDEFDVIIKTIHNNHINNTKNTHHQWLKTLVYDKQSFNTFMSEYLPCVPFVIYVFTMNSTPEEINELDSSYIRNNRIDININLCNKKDV